MEQCFERDALHISAYQPGTVRRYYTYHLHPTLLLQRL